MIPTLTSRRLRLRPWTLDDIDAAFAVYSHEEVARRLSPAMDAVRDPHEMRLVLQHWIAENHRSVHPTGRWAVELTEEGRVIGGVTLLYLPPGGTDLEIGWQRHRGTGCRGGGQSRPYLISQITDARGRVLYQRADSASVPVYPVFESAQMVRMMEGVITAGTARGAGFGRPAAGKTGTSQDHRDAWFVGFTPDWLCAVWVGNDDNRPMSKVTGGQIPAAVWRRFMVEAHRGLPVRDFDWFPAVLPPPAPRLEPTRPRVIAVRNQAAAPALDLVGPEPDWAAIPY